MQHAQNPRVCCPDEAMAPPPSRGSLGIAGDASHPRHAAAFMTDTEPGRDELNQQDPASVTRVDREAARASRRAVVVVSAIGSFLAPTLFLFAAPIGSPAPGEVSPADLPPNAPLVAALLVAVGAIAAILVGRARLSTIDGWRAMLTGAAIGLGLQMLVRYGGPVHYPLTRVQYIVAALPVPLAGFAAMAVGYLTMRATAARRATTGGPAAWRGLRPSVTLDAVGRAMTPIVLVLLVSTGTVTLTSYWSYVALTAEYPTVAMTISKAGITIAQPVVPAGRVNLVIKANDNPACPVGGAPSGEEWLLLTSGDQAMSPLVPPVTVAFRPRDVTEDNAVELAPGTYTWSCGSLQATMTVR